MILVDYKIIYFSIFCFSFFTRAKNKIDIASATYDLDKALVDIQTYTTDIKANGSYYGPKLQQLHKSFGEGKEEKCARLMKELQEDSDKGKEESSSSCCNYNTDYFYRHGFVFRTMATTKFQFTA